MAALQHGAAFTPSVVGHRRFTPGKINPVRPILLISSFSSSFPTKRTGRRNHLRQKILKTLKKPIIPKLPPANPVPPIDSPSHEIEENGNTQEIREPEKSDISETGNEEAKNSEELSEIEGSVSFGEIDGNVGIFPKKSILKYGLWLVGAFVFQTVCAIWFFGSADIENKSESLNGSGESRVQVVLNGNENGKVVLRNSAINSNVHLNEMEMERKIEEIRVMAREAREKERLDPKRNVIDSEVSEATDGSKYSKSGIEEEVDNRLVRLRKKFGNARLKMPVASVGYARNKNARRDGVEKGELNERESSEALLFEKKYKFRGLSVDPIEKPKGFGSDNTRIRSGNGDKNSIGLRDEENQTQGAVVDSQRIDAGHVVEEGNKKWTSERTEPTSNSRMKVERERGRSKQRKGNIVAKPKVVDGNSLEKNIGRRSTKETDFWWLNLPYVLAIVMQRGDDGEGGEGLYTLRSISSTKDQVSHLVAFEDQADATNFCYLLQSFFDDLEMEDFQADVVPLTIAELKDALKLFDDKLLVVKRGQLRLFAGQPLTDAEVALRAMI